MEGKSLSDRKVQERDFGSRNEDELGWNDKAAPHGDECGEPAVRNKSGSEKLPSSAQVYGLVNWSGRMKANAVNTAKARKIHLSGIALRWVSGKNHRPM